MLIVHIQSMVKILRLVHDVINKIYFVKKPLIFTVFFLFLTNDVFSQKQISLDDLGNYIIKNIRDSLSKYEGVNNVYFIKFNVDSRGNITNETVNNNNLEVDISKYPSMHLLGMEGVKNGLITTNKIERLIKEAIRKINSKIISKQRPKTIFILPIFIIIETDSEYRHSNFLSAVQDVFQGKKYSNVFFLKPATITIIQ